MTSMLNDSHRHQSSGIDIREAAIKSGAYRAAISSFAETLRKKMAA